MVNTQDMLEVLTNHYNENRYKLVKRLTYRTGSVFDAEDCVQETYERALRYLYAFNGKQFGAWINMVMNNVVREHKNAAKGHSTDPYDEEEEEGVPCTHYSERVTQEINDLIETKSLVQIDILKLYFQQDYSAKDISRVTEYSHSNCRQIISRFRQELQDLYGKD